MGEPSRFNHALCAECWEHHYPHRVPVRVSSPDGAYAHKCCDCGRVTVAGIFLREEPDRFGCGGKHDA